MSTLAMSNDPDVIDKVFVSQRPRRKIPKVIRHFNKRVARAGANLTRTTGFVDSDYSDSDSDPESAQPDLSEESLNKLAVVHDSFVRNESGQTDARFSSNANVDDYDYDVDEHYTTNAPAQYNSHHGVQVWQEQARQIQQGWGGGTDTRRQSSTQPQIAMFKGHPQQAYTLYQPPAPAPPPKRTKPRPFTEYREGVWDPFSVQNPSNSQNPNFIDIDDSEIKTRGKKSAEARQKALQQEWKRYIDFDSDQDSRWGPAGERLPSPAKSTSSTPSQYYDVPEPAMASPAPRTINTTRSPSFVTANQSRDGDTTAHPSPSDDHPSMAPFGRRELSSATPFETSHSSLSFRHESPSNASVQIGHKGAGTEHDIFMPMTASGQDWIADQSVNELPLHEFSSDSESFFQQPRSVSSPSGVAHKQSFSAPPEASPLLLASPSKTTAATHHNPRPFFIWQRSSSSNKQPFVASSGKMGYYVEPEPASKFSAQGFYRMFKRSKKPTADDPVLIPPSSPYDKQSIVARAFSQGENVYYPDPPRTPHIRSEWAQPMHQDNVEYAESIRSTMKSSHSPTKSLRSVRSLSRQSHHSERAPTIRSSHSHHAVPAAAAAAAAAAPFGYMDYLWWGKDYACDKAHAFYKYMFPPPPSANKAASIKAASVRAPSVRAPSVRAASVAGSVAPSHHSERKVEAGVAAGVVGAGAAAATAGFFRKAYQSAKEVMFQPITITTGFEPKEEKAKAPSVKAPSVRAASIRSGSYAYSHMDEMEMASIRSRSIHGSPAPSIHSRHTLAPTIRSMHAMEAPVNAAPAGTELAGPTMWYTPYVNYVKGPLTSNSVDMFRHLSRLSVILKPLDAVADMFPSLQGLVVVVELAMLMWVLYQVSILIQTLAIIVKTLCFPVVVLIKILGLQSPF